MKIFLEEWLPVVGSYTISLISYILLIINMVSGKRRNMGMHMVVKEKVNYVDEEVLGLKTYLTVLEKKQNDAILEISRLQAHCYELEQTLTSILEVEDERSVG